MPDSPENSTADATNRRARGFLAVQHEDGYVARTGGRDRTRADFSYHPPEKNVSLIVQMSC